MKLLTLLSVVGFASAACPNNCAGHGTCGDATQCDCYRNWFGADCSKRICTYSAAFVDTPVGDLNGDGEHGPARYFDPRLNTKVYGIDHTAGGQSELYSHVYGYARASRITPHDEAHFYRECANKGTCDRTTGVCACFPGYEGEGCTRTSCPDNCNGHGRCRTFADDHPTYSAWDLHHTQNCVCDPGYSGPSCAMRECPRGADPVQYALEVTNSVQGIFWRSFNGAAANANAEQEYAKDKPSKVHYTITFKDEYGDEHVTSLLSVDYKSTCTGDKKCFTHPDFGVQTLQEHAESVNQSLGALPRGAIENKYVWAVGTTYDAAGAAQEHTVTDPKDGSVKQKYYTYPRDYKEVVKAGDPHSVNVDQLEYRLDKEIIPAGCKGNNINGADNAKVQNYGLCLFVQLENPGIQYPLKVQYFYKPDTKSTIANNIQTHVISGETMKFNLKSITADDKSLPGEVQYLVTVQDLQENRKWNERDGDVSKLFISESTVELAVCSKRGLCDYDTGMCDCFSGYSGIRCDDQNAIAYSY